MNCNNPRNARRFEDFRDGGKAAMSLGQHGFAVVNDLVPVSELSEICDRCEEIDRAGTRRVLDESWCQKLALQLHRRLADYVPLMDYRQAVQCTFFNKTEQANWFVAYHQDRSVAVADSTPASYPGFARKEGMTFVQPDVELMNQMLAVRLELDGADAQSGALRVLPGTHLSGILEPKRIAALQSVVDGLIIEAKAGAGVLLSPLLLHASSKSKAPGQRRVLHFLFAPRDDQCGLEWRLFWP